MTRRLLARVTVLRSAWERYQADDGPLMAAAVSYYVGLSIFPLALVLIAGLGWFLRYTETGQSAEQQLLQAVAMNMSPTLGQQVRTTLEQVQDRSSVNGPIGLFVVLMTALAAFSQFERAFDRIWGHPRPAAETLVQMGVRLVVQRGTAFALLLLLGFFLIAVLATGLTLSAIRSATSNVVETPEFIWQLIRIGSTLLLNGLLFMAIYRWLPKSRVRWRDAAWGGLMAAILWEVGRYLLSTFLIGAKYSSAYGVVGSFIAIMLWCYYAVTVVFLGAEVVRLSGMTCEWAEAASEQGSEEAIPVAAAAPR